MEKVKNWIEKFNWERLSIILTIEILLLIILVTIIIPKGGMDLYVYYLPISSGDLTEGFTPYFAQWFLFPLQFIPYQFAWPVLSFLTLVTFVLVSKKTEVNTVFLLLAFPTIIEIYLGQIDVLIVVGLYLFIFRKNHFLRGFGLLLALIKPQITIYAILYTLIEETWETRFKLLFIPTIALFISLIMYGPLWPVEWMQNSIQNLPAHPWRIESDYLWLIGLAIFWLPWMIKDYRTKIILSLLIATLASPYFSIYSFSIILLFRSYWWTTLLSYAWLLLVPVLGKSAINFAYILPISMIIHILNENITEIKDLLKKRISKLNWIG